MPRAMAPKILSDKPGIKYFLVVLSVTYGPIRKAPMKMSTKKMGVIKKSLICIVPQRFHVLPGQFVGFIPSSGILPYCFQAFARFVILTPAIVNSC